MHRAGIHDRKYEDPPRQPTRHEGETTGCPGGTATDPYPAGVTILDPSELTGGPVAPLPDPPLTPAQRDTLDRLGAAPDERPTFPAGLRDRLRALLEEELSGPATAVPDGETLFVNKRALAGVHGCEARWQADDAAPFAPSVPVVVGSVAHKAIELSLNRRRPGTPGDLVERALGSLSGSDRWMGEWLECCDEDDRAEVRALAVAKVAAFDEIWPPLSTRWVPVTEASVRQPLLGGRIVLGGKVDLSLGRAEGLTARKVIVDLKTGRFNLHHRDDLRFYALVETLRIGTPPRAVATSYLESGELHVEAVTEEMLEAAVARTVDGVERIVGIRYGGDDPVRRPSSGCRWCPVLDGCDVGRVHLDSGDDRGPDPSDW